MALKRFLELRVARKLAMYTVQKILISASRIGYSRTLTVYPNCFDEWECCIIGIDEELAKVIEKMINEENQSKRTAILCPTTTILISVRVLARSALGGQEATQRRKNKSIQRIDNQCPDQLE
jgi:hypothetical protein